MFGIIPDLQIVLLYGINNTGVWRTQSGACFRFVKVLNLTVAVILPGRDFLNPIWDVLLHTGTE